MLVGETTMKNKSVYSQTGQLGPRPSIFEVFRSHIITHTHILG